MNYKKIAIVLLILSGIAIAQEQQKMVSVPEDQLTEQQKQNLKLQQVDTTVEKAHGWVGMGKELGQAFDSAMSSLTARSNEFAQTPVGKFTMFLVAWKVMGEQAGAVANAIVHFVGGFIELIVFFPILLWSYRKSCMDKRICTSREGFFLWGKRTYEYVPFRKKEDDRYAAAEKDITQWAHLGLFLLLGVVWLFTVFSY
jgi:hypothetical protein